MTKTTQLRTAKTWTKPELVRLGKIADVAGNAGAIIDGQSVNPKAS